MKEKIIDSFIYIISITLFILVVVFQHELFKLFISLSIYSLLLGISILFKKRNYSLILISLGISGLVTSLVYYKKILPYYDCYTFMIALSLTLILLLTILFTIINRIKINKIYSLKVTATVIDLEKNPNTKKEYYRPIYRYKIENKTYEVGYPGYKKNFIPKINDTLTILINPHDYQETCFLKEKKETFMNIGASIFFIIASIIIIIGLF